MQILFEFVQKLCALVMLALLSDLLMPTGTMRKYVRLSCGLLVLHIMVSQVFVLFGRDLPDVTAQEWTQLVGEMAAISDDAAGQEAALAAFQRQAERLVIEKARALGMTDPLASLAWNTISHRLEAVILHERAPSVAAAAQAGDASGTPQTLDTQSIRAGIAAMLGLPARAVMLQMEGDDAP